MLDGNYDMPELPRLVALSPWAPIRAVVFDAEDTSIEVSYALPRLGSAGVLAVLWMDDVWRVLTWRAVVAPGAVPYGMMQDLPLWLVYYIELAVLGFGLTRAFDAIE